MKIIQSKRFRAQLSKIVEFIAERSEDAAENFKNELFARAGELGFMPYKFRRSKSFDDDRIRDFVFKGFVIPYLIDEPNDTIVILAIFKQNLLRYLDARLKTSAFKIPRSVYQNHPFVAIAAPKKSTAPPR